MKIIITLETEEDEVLTQADIDAVTALLTEATAALQAESGAQLNTAAFEAAAAALQAELFTVSGSGLAVSSAALPAASVGNPYSGQVSATGGTPPYAFSASPNSLNGLTLNADGSISGAAIAAGTATFAVTVTDSTGATASGSVSVTAS